MVNTMQRTWRMGDTVSYIPLTDVHGVSAISFGAENSPFKVIWELIDWIPDGSTIAANLITPDLEPSVHAGFGG